MKDADLCLNVNSFSIDYEGENHLCKSTIRCFYDMFAKLSPLFLVRPEQLRFRAPFNTLDSLHPTLTTP